MPRSGKKKRSEAGAQSNQKRRWGGGLQPKLILIQVGALLLLALSTVWLQQRGERVNDTAEFASRGRAMTELVAVAVGPEISYEDSARFLRILERTARDGSLMAGAVLDSTGFVVAHTDVSRMGVRLDLPTTKGNQAAQELSALRLRLFGKSTGRAFLHPVLGNHGPVGTVALLMPEPPSGILNASSFKLLIPAALLLLAFVGLTMTTVRQAVRPAADFLEWLTDTIEKQGDGTERKAAQPQEYDQAMEHAVSSVSALNEAKETLTIENRALDFERRKRERVLDHLPDGVISIDAVGKVTLVNRAAATMFHLSPEDAQGHLLGELPERLAVLLRDAQRTGRATAELSGEGPEPVQLLVQRIPLASGGKPRAGTLFILRDMTAQHAVMRAQGEFLSQVSHELKAPLNSILALVEALADDDLLTQDDRKVFSNSLNTETQRMTRLISNLLQLSRIQLGNLSARFGFVKSGSLVSDLTDTLRAQAEGSGLVFETDIPDNLPALHGDKDLLGVAITNLITNAFKYTASGGRVTVSAGSDGSDVIIEVADTGIGISSEDQARVFERFFRSEDDAVRQRTGSGLGLSLVAEIAEIHEGSVSVESQVGKGSTFRLRLPSREVGSHLNVAA
jgi:signal transduction histidine kinase